MAWCEVHTLIRHRYNGGSRRCIPQTWVPTASVRWWTLPGTLVYTWLGVTGEQALQGGNLWPLFLALTSLCLLSLLPLLVKQCRQTP